MQHYDWQNKYLLGIKEIDYQHEYFLQLINRLADEVEHVDHLEYRLLLLAELKAYVRYHFISEENMMYKEGYPDLEAHKQHHRQLLDALAPKITNLEITKSQEELEKLVDYLVEWFFHHTASEDRGFSNYLARRDAAGQV